MSTREDREADAREERWDLLHNVWRELDEHGHPVEDEEKS